MQFLHPYFWGMKAVPIFEVDRLPERPGIYYAIDSNFKVIYIGKAENLHNRWSRHEKRNRLVLAGCTHLRYRQVPKHWLLFEEACEIERWNPPANFQHPDPEKQWNWQMRLDCWMNNLGVALASSAIAFTCLHLMGSPVPAQLLDDFSTQIEEVRSR